jgi:hypothetical protein
LRTQKHLRIRGVDGPSAFVFPDLIRDPDLPLTLMLRCEHSEPRSIIQLDPSFEAFADAKAPQDKGSGWIIRLRHPGLDPGPSFTAVSNGS